MDKKKILSSCLLAVILVGPTIQGLNADPKRGKDQRGGRHHGKGQEVSKRHHRHWWNKDDSNRGFYLEEIYIITEPGEPAKTYTVPADILAMGPDVDMAIAKIRSMDSAVIEKKGLKINQEIVVNLFTQFFAEYDLYEDMISRNDPSLKNQENKLRSIYKTFKKEYESFLKAAQ